MGVGLLCVNVCQLSVQNKIASQRAESRSDFSSDEGEREHRAILQHNHTFELVFFPRYTWGVAAQIGAKSPKSGGAHLVSRVKQELVRIHSVRDGAPNYWNIMKDYWGLGGIPRCELDSRVSGSKDVTKKGDESSRADRGR